MGITLKRKLTTRQEKGGKKGNASTSFIYIWSTEYIAIVLFPSTCIRNVFILQTKLDGFLAAPDHLMLPHTRLLLASAFRRTLQQRTAEAVCTVYKKLHEIVHNPNHGYTDPSSLLPRDPETVKTLLS